MEPMTNSARIKGRDFEALIRRWLTTQGQPNSNPATIGRPGGDIILHNHPIMLEVKNRKQMALAEWIRQAEADAGELLAVIVHKRKGVSDPGEQWCTMTLSTFVEILGERQNQPATPSVASGLPDTTSDSSESFTDDLETILAVVEAAIEQSKQARQA